MRTVSRKTRQFASYADVSKTYRKLCELYLPRPIHDADEDGAATEMMNALAVFPKLNPEQQDYLDALTEFVDAYDKAKTVRWPKVKGLGVLKHLLAEHKVSGADLSRLLDGSRNLGAMILWGRPQSHPATRPQAGCAFQGKPWIVRVNPVQGRVKRRFFKIFRRR
jgi:HTH-type transcriptional regulator/antitoxin HigA